MSATLSAEALSAFESYQRNFRWAKEHDSSLQEFEGEFVAVDDDQVVAHGDDRAEVASKVHARASAYITFVAQRGLVWIL